VQYKARAYICAAVLLLSFGLLQMFEPSARTEPTHNINTALPDAFDTWVRAEYLGLAPAKVIAPAEAGDGVRVSEAIYFGSNNERVMVSLSYAPNQFDSRFTAHRPEYCYKAQGFSTGKSQDSALTLANQELAVRSLKASKGPRQETITYWMTLSGETVLPGLSRMAAQLSHAVQGEVPDGYLVRVSTIHNDQEHAFRINQRFLEAWTNSLDSSWRAQLVGRP